MWIVKNAHWDLVAKTIERPLLQRLMLPLIISNVTQTNMILCSILIEGGFYTLLLPADTDILNDEALKAGKSFDKSLF